MKKLLTLMLAVSLLIATGPTLAGREDKMAVIHISTLEQLQAMKDDLTADYILDNDIDAAATSGWNGGLGFEPIGDWANKFIGSFDGQNHKITGLFINRPALTGAGLFGDVEVVSLKNVSIVNSDITAEATVGALVGIVRSNSAIANCHSSGTVTGNAEVGGLIGTLWGNSEISNCDSACNIFSHAGAVTKVGGLIGEIVDSTLSNCFATGDITCGPGWGECYIAGLIGLCQNSILSNSYAQGNVEGFNYTGGLCGIFHVNSEMSNCSAEGDVSGRDNVGGLIGLSQDSPISDSYATGNVTGTGYYAGGLIGYNDNCNIKRCCASGNAIGGFAGTKGYVGGLIGVNGGEIEKCYSVGDVQGGNYVGGLIGDNGGPLSNCYSHSNVSGGSNVGGLLGHNAIVIPSNCYSSGAVSGTGSYIGGLIGRNAKTATNCFWDTETSGQAVSAGGTGKTTEEMKTKSTFTDAGWDFDIIWNISSYPWLRGCRLCEEAQQVFVGYIG